MDKWQPDRHEGPPQILNSSTAAPGTTPPELHRQHSPNQERIHARPRPQRPYGSGVRTAIAIFAFALPVFSLLFEFATGAMAEIYADPIPTLWHIAAGALLLASIVAVDFFLGRTRDGKPPRWIGWAFFLNGYALALGTVYFLIYLPVLPIAAICLTAFGLGLMGFSPLACMLASAWQLRTLFRYLPELGVTRGYVLRSVLAGIAAVLVLAGAYAGPEIVSKEFLRMAASDDTQEHDRGVWWIQTLGFEDELLEACYAPVVRGVGPTRRWNPRDIDALDEYRALYFRLTGVPYNSVPRPAIRSTFRNRSADWWEEERQADSEVGGMAVAGRVAGLSLLASHLDGKIMRVGADASAPGVAYFEWIIEFDNTSSRQREARARIEVPHGAVASRLTLWIEGVECEAAFGTRQQVLDAYQDVAVVRRCDPALLNVAGQDTLMLQCFPIQPKSTMKVKLGITAPLTVRDGKSYLRLPYLSERNFTISPGFEHVTSIESDLPIEAKPPSITVEEVSPGRVALRGNVDEAILQEDEAASVVVAMAEPSDRTYSDSLSELAAEMTVAPVGADPPASSLCIVLDGSKSMEQTKIDWAVLLDSLPENARVNAVFAGPAVETYSDTLVDPSPEMAQWLDSREFYGGCDPIPAIVRALDLLGYSGGAILWVHGPLPVELSSMEALDQWERRRGTDAGVRVLSIQAVPGPNRALEQLSQSAILERVPVLGSLDATLQYAAKHQTSRDVEYSFQLTQPAETATETDGSTAGGHIVRLAVNDAVRQAVLTKRMDRMTEAADLAVMSRIVTPLSGAVVLERADQYARHGLDPGEYVESIPGIPEPEEWALMAVVLLALMAVAVRQHRARVTERA